MLVFFCQRNVRNILVISLLFRGDKNKSEHSAVVSSLIEQEAASSEMVLKEKSSSRLMKEQKDSNSQPSSPEPLVSLYDKDLICMLAEVNFINGEVSILDVF